MTTDNWRWPHVRLVEVQCKHCAEHLLHEPTLDAFEALRRALGGNPIPIYSGYRCPVHNARVGGAPNSFHLKGMALDIAYVPKSDLELTRFAQEATRAGFGGIGLYPHKGFTHVDTGPIRRWHGDE